MRKITIMLAIAAAAGLTACSKSETNTSNEATVTAIDNSAADVNATNATMPSADATGNNTTDHGITDH